MELQSVLIRDSSKSGGIVCLLFLWNLDCQFWALLVQSLAISGTVKKSRQISNDGFI